MVYLEGAIQEFFLKIVICFRYTWGIPLVVSFSIQKIKKKKKHTQKVISTIETRT